MLKQKHFDPIGLTAGILLAVTAVLNCIAIFFLPSTMSAGPTAQRIPTLTFLAGGILLVGVCGIMAVFGQNAKKWILFQSALTVLNVVLVAYQWILSA